MRLIFNESFVEKRDLWVPWLVHGPTRKHWNAFSMEKKKEKKVWNAEMLDTDSIQTSN